MTLPAEQPTSAAVLALLALLAVAPPLPAAPTSRCTQIDSRRVCFEGAEQSGAPLLIYLHGYGSSGRDGGFGLPALALRHGFIYAAPDALPDEEGRPAWRLEDLPFIEKLIALSGADPHRVYLVGFSLGAIRSLDFICARPGLAAAVVAVSGTRFIPLAKCEDGAVSTLLVHGDADEVIAYGGGAGRRTGARYLSAAETFKAVAGNAGCGALAPAPDRKVGAVVVYVDKAGSCRGGARVELWTVPGGGHAGIRDPAFAESIWAFLSSPR